MIISKLEVKKKGKITGKERINAKYKNVCIQQKAERFGNKSDINREKEGNR